VVRLEPLDDEALAMVVDRALRDRTRGLADRGLTLEDDARARLVALAGGDARRALTILEAAAAAAPDRARIDRAAVVQAAQARVLHHDKEGDQHFDLLSALHKSLRNSDPDAAVYWLARMIEAGADPVQAARRMVAMAAEDIGLADPMALSVAVAAMTAFQQLGLPEGRLPLCEAAVYLATAPKSNAVCVAIDEAAREVREGRQHAVPDHLRNAPTRLAKELGHGAGYRYAHDEPGGVADMRCLPEGLADRRFYRPGSWGFEEKVRARLAEIAERRAKSRAQGRSQAHDDR
jgi:putative ATPase